MMIFRGDMRRATIYTEKPLKEAAFLIGKGKNMFKEDY
jgi:hypothetical protein